MAQAAAEQRRPAAIALPQQAQAGPVPAASQDGLKEFDVWVKRFQQGTPEARAAMVGEGIELARQRQDLLFGLIARDPAAALAEAVAEPIRRLLPEAMLPLLEKPVSARGDLVVIAAEHAPGAPADEPDVYREAHIDGQSLEACVYGRRASLQTKYGTSLIGIVVQNRMAVLEEPARILSTDDLPAGAVLEPPLDNEPASPLIVQVAGRYFPVSSGARAAEVASRWAAAESHPGPILEADGLPGADTAASTTPPPPQLASSHLLGPQSVLVILTSYSDGGPLTDLLAAPQAIDANYVRAQLINGVAGFYSQASYGQATIGAVDVTGVLSMPSPLASYAPANTAGLENDAKNAARAAGFVPENYNRVIMVFPGTTAFSWTGLGELGGSFIWVNGTFQVGVVAHELGHNFGLSHARLWAVPAGSTNPVDPAATSRDYGDVFDIMGYTPGNPVILNPGPPDPPNPWYLNNLGWLPDSSVQTITGEGTYRVYRFDDQGAMAAGSTLALKINRSEGTDYWVAFRRKFAGDPLYGNISTGAYVFWAQSGSPSSQLIEMNPLITGNPSVIVAQNSELAQGRTFNDTAAGITLQVTGTGGEAPNEYLDIAVTYQTRIAFEHAVTTVNEQAGSAVLNVFRLGSGSGAVTVSYTTADGTALAGQNYTATSGSLQWADGDTTPRAITVPVTANSLTTGTASFTVKLSAGSGSMVFPGGPVATVNIVQPGATDPGFVQPFLTNVVNTLALQPDGSLIIGGDFDNTTVPVSSNGISRLQPGGALDITFDQGMGANALPVTALCRQPDGKVLVAGAFTSLRGVARSHLARLQPNGGLDAGFNPGTGPGAGGAITALCVQPDGKILVGGQFLTWNGASNKTLVRLNEDGTLDTTFAHFDSVVQFVAGHESVSSIALQPSAVTPYYTILAGGGFYRNGGGGFHSGIIRLKADGTRDTTFDAIQGAHASKMTNSLLPVTTVAAQVDGKVLAAGGFTGFNGVSVNGLVRLTSTGANDSAFVTKLGTGLTSTQAYWDVTGLWVQPDGRIVAGGYFEKAAGQPHLDVARFNADGSPDSIFNASIEGPASSNGVNAMAVGPDNSIYIALNNSGASPRVVKRLFSGLPAQAGVVQFTSPATTLTMGDNAVVTVSRIGGSLGAISVNYLTVARSAVAGTDFIAAGGTLTWANGDANDKTLTVPTLFSTASSSAKVFEIHLGIPLGGTSIGQNAIAGVNILTPDLGDVPQAAFATTSATYTESVSTQTVTVQLSLPHSDTITVPFTVSGSAVMGAGKAYTLNTAPLVFGPGVMSQNISINLLEDKIAEPQRSIIITLKPPTTGTAMLGTGFIFTAALQDDDIPPFFPTLPVNVLTTIGTGASFGSVPAGNPAPALAWYKNGVKLSPAVTVSGLALTNVQLTHAGQYSVIASNIYGTGKAMAELGVVDPKPKFYNVTAGTTATLTATAAGNKLTYVWTKANEAVLAPPRITASGASLTIKSTTIADAGAYNCAISGPGTGPVNVTFNLNIIDGAPVITNTGAMTAGIVSGTYSYPITVSGAPDLTPASFSATGLPAGLTCNATNGLISGKPTVSTKGKAVNVTLKATNAKGTGSFATTLIINDLAPGTVGSFTGPLSRHATLNGGLGGRFDLATTGTGAFTGMLTLGASGFPFKGVLDTAVGAATASATVSVVRSGKTAATLAFAFDATTGRLTSGSVTADGATGAFTGWRGTTPGSTWQGYQTFSLKIDNSLAGNDLIPQGLGYGSFTVGTGTTFTVVGVLAEGTAYTCASSLGSQGDVLVYQALYTGTKGSILGTLNITAGTVAQNADSHLSGSLSWQRPPLSGRTYASGFGPLTLTADGGRYLPPAATALPPGFTTGSANAALSFASAHVSDGTPNPGITFTLKPGGGVTVQANAAKTSMTMTPATGAFSGSFTQSTSATRTGTYKGIMVNHQGTVTGDGWFTLPQLPAPATSSILSGSVLLSPPGM